MKSRIDQSIPDSAQINYESFKGKKKQLQADRQGQIALVRNLHCTYVARVSLITGAGTLHVP
jgi:hypothetical protein